MNGMELRHETTGQGAFRMRQHRLDLGVVRPWRAATTTGTRHLDGRAFNAGSPPTHTQARQGRLVVRVCRATQPDPVGLGQLDDGPLHGLAASRTLDPERSRTGSAHGCRAQRDTTVFIPDQSMPRNHAH